MTWKKPGLSQGDGGIEERWTEVEKRARIFEAETGGQRRKKEPSSSQFLEENDRQAVKKTMVILLDEPVASARIQRLIPAQPLQEAARSISEPNLESKGPHHRRMKKPSAKPHGRQSEGWR